MNNSNASSCLHFTKKMTTLKSILRNGLRYSFAFEELPHTIINNSINEFSAKFEPFKPIDLDNDVNWGMAIPMISFCDIPITRAYAHACNYGKYIIGIDKRFLLDNFSHFFNPVFYVNCKTVQDAISFFTSERLKTMDRIMRYSIENTERISDVIKKTNFTSKEIIDSFPEGLKNECNQRFDESYYSYVLMSLYKPIFGKDVYGKERVFFDEREWRMYMPDLVKTPLEWIKSCTREEYLDILRKELNNNLAKCNDAYVTLPPNCWDAITHIVVRYNFQRDLLITHILNANKLFGYKIQKDCELKYKLIGKISSFEQIEKDY